MRQACFHKGSVTGYTRLLVGIQVVSPVSLVNKEVLSVNRCLFEVINVPDEVDHWTLVPNGYIWHLSHLHP